MYSPLAVDSGLSVNRYVWELQDRCFYKPANPAAIRQRSNKPSSSSRKQPWPRVSSRQECWSAAQWAQRSAIRGCAKATTRGAMHLLRRGGGGRRADGRLRVLSAITTTSLKPRGGESARRRARSVSRVRRRGVGGARAAAARDRGGPPQSARSSPRGWLLRGIPQRHDSKIA